MPDQNALLAGVKIRFNTHNDDKDGDTIVDVAIRNRSSIFLSTDLATLNNITGHFDDPSEHEFNLNLASNNIKVSDLSVPIVHIDIRPNGNDRWIFDYTVTLTFSDGTIYSSSKQGVILDQDNRTYEGVFQS